MARRVRVVLAFCAAFTLFYVLHLAAPTAVPNTIPATVFNAVPGTARAQAQPGEDEAASAQLEADIVAFEELLNDRISQLGSLENALAETGVVLGEQLAERDRLEAEIVELSAQRQRLNEQVSALEAQQRAAAARIESLQGELSGLEAQLQELLLSLHKRRAGRYARLLAESESLFELRVRSYYLSQITQQDVALIGTLEDTVAVLDTAREERAQRLQLLAQRGRELADNGAALDAAQSELAGVIAALESTRAGQLAQQQALLGEQSDIESNLVGARTELAAELERLRQVAARRAEAERRRAEAAARAAEAARQAQARTESDELSPPSEAATGTATDRGTGEDSFEQEAARLEELIRALSEPAPATVAETDFAAPFSNPVVVRPYGEGGGSDIWLQAEAPGTAVQAVKSGVVYQASRITANSGYTVAIQHDDDLISAYTNLQPPEVAFGDQVRQGQILGYLGGGIVSPDILQFRLGTQAGPQIVYQDPAPLLGISGP